MNKRKVTWLIVLMAVAQLGIITIQVVWMNNALSVRNELFDRSVKEAMINTAHRIETMNDVFVVNHLVNPPFFDPGSGAPFKMQSGANPYGQKPPRENGEREPDNKKGKHNIEVYTSNSSGKQIKMRVVDLDSVISNWESQIDENFAIFFSDATKNIGPDSLYNFTQQFGYRVDRLKNVAGKMAFETWRWNQGFNADTSLLRTTFKEELQNRNIPIGFAFGLGNHNDLMMKSGGADSVKLVESKYRSGLNPNDIYNRGDYFMVYFPERKAFLFRTMVVPAALSVVFCTVVMVAFIVSIFYIIRQKKVSEMKSDFINNMTHEFKTPLATISLAADMLVNPKVIENTEQVRHFTSMVKKENARMNKQVETILQIARLDRKDFEFSFKVADLHDLVDKAVQGIQFQVESRNGSITVEKNALNAMVTTDPVHALNMLNNLLDNANKYSKDLPEITIKTRNAERGVWVTVSDKGIGMTKQVQAKIFEKFYRETSGNIHNVKGFGLGLSYVKAVVEANKGEIRVSSEPGKGSIFEVFLPFTLDG